jgi:hypothetical protein
MKTKQAESVTANEVQFELKYCERCGGLWLRPVSGGQVYCVACGREIAELPPVTYKPDGMESARLPQGPDWGGDDSNAESYGEFRGLDLDAWGGVA